MKNFNGTPLEINQIQGVDFLGYELVDKENGIRYELVNEPWVSLCAAAMSGGGKRKLTGDYKVIYSDRDYAAIGGKVVKYVPNWESLPVALDVSSLYDLIYDVDYNTFELTIYFDQWHEDIAIDTRQLENCSKVNLVYIGKPFATCDDLAIWTNESAVGNYGNYTMTILNDQAPVEITGNIMVAPQNTGASFFMGLFICKNANVNVKNFGLQINPGTYTKAVSTSRPGWIYGERSNLTFEGKFLFYYWMGALDTEQSRPAAHVSIDKYTTMTMENNTYFDFNGKASGTGNKWVMHGPYFYIGFHCNAVIRPGSRGSVVNSENFIGPGDVDSGLIYVGGGFNYVIWTAKVEHLVQSIHGSALSSVNKDKNVYQMVNT